MKNKLNGWLIGGIVAGLIAFIALFNVLSSATKTEAMVVAAQKIAPDMQITPAMLKVVYTRPSDVPSNVTTSEQAVVGRYSMHSILSGDPILSGDLASTLSAAGGSLTAALGPSDRAMAVEASVSQALAGNLSPGAVVDVIEVTNPSSNASGSVSQVPPSASYVATKVHVLAVSPSSSALANASTNTTITGSTSSSKPTSFVPGIYTLDVTSSEAEALALAQVDGTLYLVLDPPGALPAPSGTFTPTPQVPVGPTPN